MLLITPDDLVIVPSPSGNGLSWSWLTGRLGISRFVSDTWPSVSPQAASSNSAIPAISASTPVPVIAEPKNTGCTSGCFVCGVMP